MWICTSFGVLMPALRPPSSVPKGDNRVIQVRARVRKHLEILRDEYMGDDLGEIIVLGGTDYQFRAYCTREAWARTMARLALDIDYVSFKATSESKYHDRDLHNKYLQLWAKIHQIFSTREYQDSYWKRQSAFWDRNTSQRRTGSPRRRWHEEHLPDARDTEYLVDEIDTSDVDGLTTGPDLRPNGTLDHSMCSHGGGNASRKRCRRRWARQNDDAA